MKAKRVVALLVALTTCGSLLAAAADGISVQLKWHHGAQFAGFYAASKLGAYGERDLEVDLRAGGPDNPGLGRLLSREVDVALLSAAEILSARSAGHPVIAIAAVFQRNPAVYFSLVEKGITTPIDFAGRSVLYYSADFILNALLGRVGVRVDDLVIVEPGESFESFLSGDVDVWTGYLTGQVLDARNAGHAVNVVFPDDYGIHFYGDAIAVLEDTAADRADVIRRFVDASLEGWRWCVESPDSVGDLVRAFDPAADEARQHQAFVSSLPLIVTHDPLGWMDEEVWVSMCDVLVDLDVIEDIEPTEAFTMTFLSASMGTSE